MRRQIAVTELSSRIAGERKINDGEYEGNQVLPAEWVRDSLKRYSENIKVGGWVDNQQIRFLS